MSSDSDSDDYYGPALPPGFKKPTDDTSAGASDKVNEKSEPVQIGPVIPASLRAKLEATADDEPQTCVVDEDGENLSEAKSDGERSDSDSDSDVIGPLPPDHPKAQEQSMRASSTASSSESKKPKREEWMLIPPKNKIIPGIGLGPRKFLTRTPQDSKQSDEEEDEDEAFAREADAEIERNLIEQYDQKMEEMKKDFEIKKRRGESLLQIHQKEMKKKKDDKPEKAERKPFDRDTDLAISGMSSADKKKYIEKSKELNTKFSRGSRKYL